LRDISFEAVPTADNFANLYNDQAQPWELKKFCVEKTEKRRKCHQAYNTKACWRSCRMSGDLNDVNHAQKY